MIKIAMEGDFYHAQGIEAVSFFAAGKKDTSVKPGPRAGRPADAPKTNNRRLKALLLNPAQCAV
jgi:hypothetical protein